MIAAFTNKCPVNRGQRTDKTKVVDLREGREGFDFLGCHFHARVSGRLLERGIRRYYLHRWPSQRAMKRIRARIRELTDRRRRAGIRDIREVIADLNPVLRGWGNCFRTGNATEKFQQIDWHVTWRLKRLLLKREGRHLKPGDLERWTSDWLWGLGLHRLLGGKRSLLSPFAVLQRSRSTVYPTDAGTGAHARATG
jgi:RNA-directed DNA polymerase